MADSSPVVYVLHGEEEFGIAEFVQKIAEKLGDPAMAEMNTSHQEGGADIEGLRAIAYAAPFLTSHRLVIVDHATRGLYQKETQAQFIALLDGLPPTTKLVLVEHKTLADNHWLVKWVKDAGDRAFIKSFDLAKGGQMAGWIRKQATDHGGEFTNQAAYLLAEMVGQDARMADSEIQKLLDYVDRKRPVDVADVEELGAFYGAKGDFFTLIDSIGARDGRKAMNMLHGLLAEQDGMQLFFGLVGHFRLLLQAREILENGGRENDVAQVLGIHPYRAQKLFGQARTLHMAGLEQIYRQLLDYDEGVKTGRTSPELALDELVTSLTAS